MRRLVLILLITMLPMRIWAGESMAFRMAAAAISKAAGVSGATVISEMPADCPMMAVQSVKGDAPHGAMTKMNSVCHACYLCMAITTLESPSALYFPQLQQSLQMLPMSGFASADLASDIEPPIFHS